MFGDIKRQVMGNPMFSFQLFSEIFKCWVT